MAFPRCWVAGNLGGAPEVFRFDGGMGVRFSLCCNKRRKDGAREIKDTCWWECTAWGQAAGRIESAARLGQLTQGQYVLLEAEVRENRWEEDDPNGGAPKKRSRHELTVFNLWLPLPRVG